MLEKEYKERRSLIYKVFIVLVAAIGILLQCEVGTSGFSFTSFRMFTTLSNVAVAVFFVVYIALRTSVYNFPKTNTNVIRYFKFLITMSIILTGLVAHFMLRDMFEDMEPMVKMGLTFLHYVVPIATVFDWILFDEKGKTKWKKPLLTNR